jgi:hypothetical protein
MSLSSILGIFTLQQNNEVFLDLFFFEKNKYEIPRRLEFENF